MARQRLRIPHKQIRLANAFSLNIEGMTPHLETYAENLEDLLGVQQAIWRAVVGEP